MYSFSVKHTPRCLVHVKSYCGMKTESRNLYPIEPISGGGGGGGGEPGSSRASFTKNRNETDEHVPSSVKSRTQVKLSIKETKMPECV